MNFIFWDKLLSAASILTLLLTIFSDYSISPADGSYVSSDYGYVEGLLHNDTYVLYPYEYESLDIGFSKYGEMINPEVSVGLRYDEQDPFANDNVSRLEWNQGWLMNISYRYEGVFHHVWAFALYSDFSEVEGQWQTRASSPIGPPYGGRKTSGFATTEPIKVLYDGPRRLVALLNTTIYDPSVDNPEDPTDPKGLPLIRLYIQVVFNKVKKYVVLIKDIKLVTKSKLLEKVQVQFSERGEWDLGHKPAPWTPKSYAHFYEALETKYKHPWYREEERLWNGSYDLCQIIDKGLEYVGFAAFWPRLMSFTVEDMALLTREEKLTDLTSWWDTYTGNGAKTRFEFRYDMNYWFSYPNCEFPPDWSIPPPRVSVDGVPQEPDLDYSLDEDGIEFIEPPAMGAKIVIEYKIEMLQHDMRTEPSVPYVIGEWVFDLSDEDPDLPTNQFRCVTVYSVTDLNDGDDGNIGEDHDDIPDKEVMFQLDEVFNPWDLRQALGSWSWSGDEEYKWWPGEWTERHVDFFTGDGSETDFWLREQTVVPPFWYRDWNEYCSFRERVLVNGVLQVPWSLDPDDPRHDEYDYNITLTHTVVETLLEGPTEIEAGDKFNLTYPRLEPDGETLRIEGASPVDLYKDIDYNIDYTNGKIYILHDIELKEHHSLTIGYDLYFPAAFIEFTEDSTPPKGVEIKVFYSTLRIVWKVDTYLACVNGIVTEEKEDEEMVLVRVDCNYTFLRHRPVMPESWLSYMRDVYREWVEVLVNDRPLLKEGNWTIDERNGILNLTLAYKNGQIPDHAVIEVIYPVVVGRYEWTVVGRESAPVDSAGTTMVSEGLREWNNIDAKLGSTDIQDTSHGPKEPFIFANVSGPGEDREDYYDSQMAQTVNEPAGRAHLKDDWCTTMPVSSSNIIVVGGLYVNVAAEYFNDFTDAYYNRVGSYLGDGFYSHACWARNLYMNTEDIGYAIISTYKDLNGTTGLIIYGTTGEDTYYACYALRYGLLNILQWLQPGVTTIILEFDYTKHPTEECFFHVVECLGTITECTGFDYIWDYVPTGEEEVTYKILMNSFSSEFLVIYIDVNFDVPEEYQLPEIFGIAVVGPQCTYFHWDAKLHPDKHIYNHIGGR